MPSETEKAAAAQRVRSEPKGFVLVPIEATDAMMMAAIDATAKAQPPDWPGAGRPGHVQIRAAWSAMLGAAPSPPESK